MLFYLLWCLMLLNLICGGHGYLLSFCYHLLNVVESHLWWLWQRIKLLSTDFYLSVKMIMGLYAAHL